MNRYRRVACVCSALAAMLFVRGAASAPATKETVVLQSVAVPETNRQRAWASRNDDQVGPLPDYFPNLRAMRSRRAPRFWVSIRISLLNEAMISI